jgi:acetolactate synthase-1/2/3 large subunit
MTSCELATAEQEGIKVNVAIINNAFLGMVRQWQEFFYDKRYAATPMTGPDFVKLAEAHRLKGLRCNKRGDVKSTVEQALAAKGTVVIDFAVEKEDSVFPMVPAGADLDKMIRRPQQDVLLESGSDKDWEMPAAPAPAGARVTANGHATTSRKPTKPVKAVKKPSRTAAPKRAKAGR